MPDVLDPPRELWVPPGELWTPPDDLVPPAYLWVPESTSSAGLEAIDLAASAGLVLDPEQQLMVLAVLAENGPEWAALEAAIIEPRQNGKTVALQAIVLAGLFLLLEPLIIWSAHLFPTTQEAFRDLVALIQDTPHLDREVKNISFANGEEEIELFGDRRIQFKARTANSGRGLSGRRVILDEAFAVTAAMLGSLFPTMTAQPNAQIVYASSAGHVESGILRSLRDRGRAGGDPTLAYIEWCAPEGECATPDCLHGRTSVGCALDLDENLVAANPGTRRGRITIAFLRAERLALPPEEYTREVGGWWDDPPGGDTQELLEHWPGGAEPDAELVDPIAMAIDVAPNHAAAAIGACGGPVEIINARRGSAWIVAELPGLVERNRPSAIGYDAMGPVAAIIPELEKAGLRVRSKEHPEGLLIPFNGRELVEACGAFYAAVVQDQLTHRDQPILNDAIVGAARRQVGDAWKWSRRDSTVNITPLMVATIARSLWSQPPEDGGSAGSFLDSLAVTCECGVKNVRTAESCSQCGRRLATAAG